MVRGSFGDQLNKAGFNGDDKQRSRPRPQKYGPSLPDGYLKGGYFDQDGHLRKELLGSVAEEVAKSFLGRPELKSSQLRRFYGHVKQAENRLELTGDWSSVRTQIEKLSPFAHDAAAGSRPKVPRTFLEFIRRNLDLITKEETRSFTKGFVPHFEAVVAFHKYHGKE